MSLFPAERLMYAIVDESTGLITTPMESRLEAEGQLQPGSPPTMKVQPVHVTIVPAPWPADVKERLGQTPLPLEMLG